MTTEIKVLRENLIKSLSSIKDDNVSIADITINRQKLLQAVKLQTEDILTLTYGNVSWEYTYKHHSPKYKWGEDDKGEYVQLLEQPAWYEYRPYKMEAETCIQISCNHTVMRFLNRPKTRNGHESKVIPLNFIDRRDNTATEPIGTPIDPQDLLRAITFVLPCVAVEQTRPVLNCILFESHKNSIKLVAADGFRLATSKVISTGIPTDKVLIHLADIARLITFLKSIKPLSHGKGKCYPEVYLAYDNQTVKFSTKDQTLELDKRLGTFPDYSRLIPKDGAKVEFIANDMLEAVKALSNIANDGSGIIRLHFTTGKPCGKITLTAQSAEYGESNIDCDAIVESDCKIAINNKYLIDLFKLCKDIRIIAHVTQPSSPILFTIDTDRQWVVMPMFVQW